MNAPQNETPASKHPLVWALAIVLVMVAAGYTYTIVTRCQTSTFEAIKLMSIHMGACQAPPPPAEGASASPVARGPTHPIPVTRADMPCRWAWIYLGKYSPARGEYLLPPAFRFAQPKGPASPFPKAGDQLVLTADKTMLITGYADTGCDKQLSPPRGYRPETAKSYEAGQLKQGAQVTVNLVTLMPGPAADPAYVWALVGPNP